MAYLAAIFCFTEILQIVFHGSISRSLQLCRWVCRLHRVKSQNFEEIQQPSPLPPLSPPKAPSAPSFIHFSELTTTSVNVSWGEPKQPNGIIEGYRLVYEPCTPVDGEKPGLEPHNSAMSWHSSAGSLRHWFTTSSLITVFLFNSRCLSSRANLPQMSTGPAVAYMARLIKKYVGMLWWDFARLPLTLRETWLIAGWVR